MKSRNYKVTEDTLKLYLKEIGKIKVLTRKEEQVIAKKIKKGDREAFDELIRRNLKFVVSVASKYQNRGIAFVDLINEGNIGLIYAAKRFDPTKNIKFITYAIWWIRQAIQHGLVRQLGVIRLPIKEALLFNRLCEKYRDLLQKYKRELTINDFSKELNVSPEKLATILGAYNYSLSMYYNNQEEYGDLIDSSVSTPSLEEDVIHASLTKEMDDLLKGLTGKEEKILRMRFGFSGLPKTLKEVAKEIGLTRERIRQIQEQAVKKLKMRPNVSSLLDYLN